MKPILIGSKALEAYQLKLPQNPRDIDLIVDLETAKDLSWQADRKKDHILHFGTDVHLDLSLVTDNPSNQLLYDLVNQSADKALALELEISANYKLAVLVPPLEWLHALIRGHLHRMPAISPSQAENIQIWHKYITSYQLIRQHLGYQNLQVTEQPMKLIFETQFDYINSLLGDAPSMDKAETEFFDNNLKEYMPHDQLHQEIAKINRSSTELLFKRYQHNPDDSVEMDSDLFLAAPRTDQLNTIREEIMVLFLERKLLPLVVELDHQLANMQDFTQEFLEIVCHFITNLCGNGHSWLRQWCLDHYQLFNNFDTYPLEQLKHLALSFSQKAHILGQPMRITSLEDFITYHQKLLLNTSNQTPNLLAKINNPIKTNNRAWQEQNDQIFIHGLSFETKYSHFKAFANNLKLDLSSSVAKLFIRDIFSASSEQQTLLYSFKIDRVKAKIYFSLTESCGLYCTKEGTNNFIFIVETKILNSTVTFGIHQYYLSKSHYQDSKQDFNIKTQTKTYYQSQTTTYYQSHGYSRAEQTSRRYLNSYGHCPRELSEFVSERLARLALNFYYDDTTRI